MIIRKVTIHNIGPFYDPFEIEIDPRVTILTGSNDAGKSGLLRALELSLNQSILPDEQANQDHVHEIQGPVAKDHGVITVAEIELTAPVDMQGGEKVTKGDKLTLLRRPTREVHQFNYESRFKGAPLKYPAIIKPGTYGDFLLNSEINLAQPKNSEKSLLEAAFGGPFNLEKYINMPVHQWHREVREANGHLNRMLEQVMPQPGLLKLDLLPDFGGNRQRIGVQLRDRHDHVTPFGDRGSGVRKMIGFLGELVTYHQSAHHKVVLIDEPENSLHADAQHLLREFLFAMTEDGKTQIIYATHSPSMLNPMRGHQIRVLHRVMSKNGKFGTTRLLPAPEEANFLAVRTSLGISAGDSLLYAPVTIVTEGITEVRCLPTAIKRLNSAQLLTGIDADKLLGLVTFLDGNGDSYELLCRLAKAHGAKVILFLDGDKRHRVQQMDLASKHPDVPVVFITGAKEFEQIVPESKYLQALAEETKTNLGDNPSHDLATWTAAENYRKNVAFSKRVDRWFEEQHIIDFHLSKKQLMERALNLTEPADIDAAPIKELLGKIEQMLQGTSFV